MTKFNSMSLGLLLILTLNGYLAVTGANPMNLIGTALAIVNIGLHFSFSSREPFHRASGTDGHMPFYMPGRLATSFASDLAADAGTPCGTHLLGADLSCSACRLAIAARRDKVPATAARVASILKEQRRAPLTAAADALAVPLSAAIRGVKLSDRDCWDRLAASVATLTANLPTAAQRAALEVCELMVIDARTRLDASQAL